MSISGSFRSSHAGQSTTPNCISRDRKPIAGKMQICKYVDFWLPDAHLPDKLDGVDIVALPLKLEGEWFMAVKVVQNLQLKPPTTPSVSEIQQWMIQHFAQELQINPERIKINQPILSCGIDSMQVVTFVAKLEDWLGVRFSSNPLEDHSTIEALSQHIADLAGTRQ